MVVAKTDRAHAALARQFHDKTTLRREYVALLDGALPEGAIVHESYLYRDPKERRRFASTARRAGVQPPAGARYAKSEFKREKLYGNRLTLAGVRLFTGRTHQIRVHACDLGMPVIGDQLYHHARQLPALFPPAVQAAVKALSRQLLHARLLTFRHPTTGVEVVAQSPPPPDFYNIIDMLLPFSNG
jgi:23S rRNA-/tRNA-specific pseudouridylate synthase